MPRRPARGLFLNSDQQLLRFPDPNKGPFVIRADWADVEGQIVCAGIHVWKGVEPATEYRSFRWLPGAKRDGLAGTDLRFALEHFLGALWDLETASQTQLIAGFQEPQRSEEEEPIDPEMLESILTTSAIFANRRPRRVSRDDAAHFKRVAEVYQAAMAAPGRKTPTAAVERAFKCDYSTATKWIRRARHDFNFLPKTTPGRASPVNSSKARKQ